MVYVALSRVTFLGGLRLINYDPLSVIASKEVIIEYNRLKQIHKPESKIITVSKERYHKVKDVPDIVKNDYFRSDKKDKIQIGFCVVFKI